MSRENAAKVSAGETSGWPAKASTGAAGALGERNWHLASMALLSVRVIQGFIYRGGGSRLHAPSKLDPNAPNWMANKFQSAMPGALLGTDHVIAYMLQHFWLLYAGVIRAG